MPGSSSSSPSRQPRARRDNSPAVLPRAVDRHGTRTCAGCGQRVEDGREVLVRIVFGPDGDLAVDSGEGTFGRGAYVHPVLACVTRGGDKGVARRQPRPEGDGSQDHPRKAAVTIGGEPLSAASLRAAVSDAYRRRLLGLVAAARRGRSIAIGADAACAALASGEAKLVVVATDAAAAASRTEVREAVAAGRAASWGSKVQLGELVDGGREDGVAVVAFLDPRIAAAVRDAVHVVDGLRSSGACPPGAAASGPRS